MERDEPEQSAEQPGADGAVEVGLVDVHCHLLPGRDNSGQQLAESVQCARRLAEAGFTHAFCTPHLASSAAAESGPIVEAVAGLQAALSEAAVGLRVLSGAEVRIGPELLQTPASQLPLLASGQSRGGRFLLFDTWESEWPPFLEKVLLTLMHHGITPIMAHPERCAFVCDDPLNVADRLAELGVLLQLNCCILGDEKSAAPSQFSKAMREAAERLIEFDHYSFLATAAHGLETLEGRLIALQMARQRLGARTFRRLTHRNPMQLLPT